MTNDITTRAGNKTIVHTYKKTKSFSKTWHYLLFKVSGGESELTNSIKIVSNRGFNNSSHPFLMYERNQPNKWNDRITTGLKPNSSGKSFTGDTVNIYGQKKDLLTFEIDGELLHITVLKNHFTNR